MGGGVPANTTTTTTVNQSPWQNPTYQALMLGTTDKPGPITNILRSNQGYMDAYNRMLGRGITPADVVNSGKYNPTVGGAGTSFQEAAPAQTAASGGIMSLQGYAGGGQPKAKALSPAQVQAVTKYNNLIAKGETPPSALVNKINNIEKNTGRNVSPYVDSGTAAVGNVKLQDLIAKAAGSGNYPEGTGTAPYDSISSAYPQSGAVQQYTDAKKTADEKAKTEGAQEEILKQSMGQTAFVQKVKNPDGTYSLQSTNPLFNQAVNRVLDAQKLPEQFGQATTAYNEAISGLKDAAKYAPKNVSTQDYTAARMKAPTQAEVKDYDAAQMQAAQMQGREATAAQIKRGDVRDIAAQMAQVERYKAEMMQAPTEAAVKNYEAAQAQLNQMAAPKSWTDAGTAAQYMSPYMQNVVDIQKREAGYDYAKRLNELNKQAVGAKAYGGSRLAVERANAARDQAMLLNDIQEKGLQQAYQSGMGQFSAEQGLGVQAGQANLSAAQQTALANQAATNQQRQQYVSNALQAAMQAYGGQLTAAQQNQIAANASAQFNAQSQNTAYNNYVAQQLAAQQANQSMDWNVANQNAQLAQQTELANQQYGLGGFQSNLQNAQFSQQANQQNQAAINQQRQSAVNNALQAAMQAYGGQLTAEQQNQIAANAASQFNAQQSLQGQMANQQAGLTANQQNLGAYGQVLQGAQGLGALGASQASTNLANIGALGQGASAWQNLGQQYLNTQSQNAQNAMNLPSNLYSPVVNMINSQQATGGTNVTNASSSPASWMGSKAKGGEVEAHKEWDKAKGGKTAKTGIASRGWN